MEKLAELRDTLVEARVIRKKEVKGFRIDNRLLPSDDTTILVKALDSINESIRKFNSRIRDLHNSVLEEKLA